MTMAAKELDVMKHFALERSDRGTYGLVLPDAFTRALALRLRALMRRAVDLCRRAMVAYSTRRALDRLSDRGLKDIGLTRGQIGFAAEAVSRGQEYRARSARR